MEESFYSCYFKQTADGQTETVQTGTRFGLLFIILHTNNRRSETAQTVIREDGMLTGTLSDGPRLTIDEKSISK